MQARVCVCVCVHLREEFSIEIPLPSHALGSGKRSDVTECRRTCVEIAVSVYNFCSLFLFEFLKVHAQGRRQKPHVRRSSDVTAVRL